MNFNRICKIAFSGALGVGMLSGAFAFNNPHEAWVSQEKDDTILLAKSTAEEKTTGQGDYKFKVLYTSSHLPELAQKNLKSAHGGFAIDRRDGKGETYFALPNTGILRISNDFKNIDLLDTPDEVKNDNMHNTAIWYGNDGSTILGFPANNSGKIYLTDLEGNLLSTLGSPKGDEFGVRKVEHYFEKNKFVPTDLDMLNGTVYITTGYSALDYVLTAKLSSDGGLKWGRLAFGGKGNKPGQFGTGHGVTISPNKDRVDVADRPVAELERFTPRGEYIDTVNLPEGAFPCDIDYEGGYTLVGCLHGKDRVAGAPIYLLKDDKVISSVVCKKDLGLSTFQHIHNAAMRVVDGKIYIIAQAWNPGDFVILEQVK